MVPNVGDLQAGHESKRVGPVGARVAGDRGFRMAFGPVLHVAGFGGPIADRVSIPPTDHLGQAAYCSDAHAVLVPARAVLVRAEEERAMVRQGWREFHDLGMPKSEIHLRRLRRRKVRSPDAEASRTHAAPAVESHEARRSGL